MKTSEKFITPCELPSDYERELLIVLIEECSEVQKRATKAMRFGLDEIQPGQDLTNRQRLSREVGDVGTTERYCANAGVLNYDEIMIGQINKDKQLKKFLQFSEQDRKDQ